MICPDSFPLLGGFLPPGNWNGAESKAVESTLPKTAYEMVSVFVDTLGGEIAVARASR